MEDRRRYSEQKRFIVGFCCVCFSATQPHNSLSLFLSDPDKMLKPFLHPFTPILSSRAQNWDQ